MIFARVARPCLTAGFPREELFEGFGGPLELEPVPLAPTMVLQDVMDDRLQPAPESSPIGVVLVARQGLEQLDQDLLGQVLGGMSIESATTAPAEDHFPVAGLEDGPGVLPATFLGQGE
jgi:hypothetical protein